MRHLIGRVGRGLGFSPLRWMRDSRRMRDLVRQFERHVQPAEGDSRFAVVVMPWLGTAVPWYSVMCGLLLAAGGSNVTFIVDDLPFGPNPIRFRFVLACIRFVMNALRPRYRILNLSTYDWALPTDAAVERTIERLADLNAVWALRGESSQPGRREYVESSAAQLRRVAGAIAGVLQQNTWDAILIPGGVYGSSGIWAQKARASGLRISSYDSGGPGVTLLCANGIACQLQDIPRAFRIFKASHACAAETRFAREFATAEVGRRRAGTDKFASQVPGSRSVDPRFEGALLIALNSSWDSAALGLHEIFDSSTQWIIDTARFVLENSSVPVVIRQHPAERIEAARTSDDYKALLHKHFGTHPRLHFIAAGEAVNSYELLERVSALVVYTSTIGVEAAMSGKVVITPSRSYYSEMGFVWKAANLAEYHEHLLNSIAGRYVVTQAMREDALLCYYLTQCCNWVHSPFSPEGFADWSRLKSAELLAQDDVRMTIESLRCDLPVAILNHRARSQGQGARS